MNLMRATKVAVVAAVTSLGGLAGCDGLLYDAAEPTVAQLEIMPSLMQAAHGVLDAYSSADRIAISFLNDGEVRHAETLPFDGSAEQVQLSVQVPLRAATETFQLTAELRRGVDPLFRGAANIEITTGGVSPVELPLQPVLAQVSCAGDPIVFDAYGATALLSAAALFATGDTIPDQTIVWSSSSSAVATVQPSGLVTSVGDGTATIQCAVGDVAGTRSVQVSAAVTSVTVLPNAATVAPGGTQQFTAVVRDRLGNALTRPVVWTSATPAVATINVAGLATGVAAGTARIEAASGGVTGSANLAVGSLPPLAVTTDASGLTSSGATLNGTVNPRGSATQAWFEYGTLPTLSTFTASPQQSVGAGTTATPVSRTVTQLLPNTTWYFRVAASNTLGTARGEIRSFRIVSAPAATTLPVVGTGTAATFRGEANPRGLSTEAWFEWGTSPTLATFSNTQVVQVGNGQSAVPVSTPASGLAPATDYYVRLAARNAEGTTRGAIVHHRPAAGGPPEITTVEAFLDEDFIFTLVGLAMPNGSSTNAWFDISFSDPQLNQFFSTGSQFMGSDFSTSEFRETIPFQTSVFWFRAAGSNEFGTVRGEIQEAYAFSMANWGRPMVPHGSLRILALLLAALLLPMAAAAQQQNADRRPGIAVLPFERGISIGAERETLDALSVGVQQILITELAQNPALRVVDRSIVRDLMAEQDLGATGRIDAQTAARIGRMVGARYVVAGGFNDNDGNFRLDGRVVDVETTEVLKAEQVTDRRANLYGIIMSLGTRLTQGVELPALAREVRTERETRGATIPREAVVLYSQAQFFADRGQTDRARELYRRITTEFPQMTEAQEALRQIGVEG